MHDPLTVAFEIRSPFKSKRGYAPSILTIWHKDPETDGTDDSCGYTFPKITKSESKMLKKLAHDQYPQLMEKQVAERQQKSYAYICSDQDSYGLIYWSVRAIKHQGKEGWQYGNDLTLKELQFVYTLFSCPNDNLKNSANKVKDEETYYGLLHLVFRSYKKFARKWWQHPKWHIKHWSIQFHPFQRLKRRYFDKCAICGKRGFKGSAVGDWYGTKIWHQECDTSSKQPNKN